MPFGFHPGFLIVLLIIVLIVFGPGKLPELGSAVGKAINEFKRASSDLKDDITRSSSAQHEEEKPKTDLPPSDTPKSDPAKS